jgi:hypothetical protein
MVACIRIIGVEPYTLVLYGAIKAQTIAIIVKLAQFPRLVVHNQVGDVPTVSLMSAVVSVYIHRIQTSGFYNAFRLDINFAKICRIRNAKIVNSIANKLSYDFAVKPIRSFIGELRIVPNSIPPPKTIPPAFRAIDIHLKRRFHLRARFPYLNRLFARYDKLAPLGLNGY